MTGSSLSGFYRLTIEERRSALARTSRRACGSDRNHDRSRAFELDSADHMIENVVGTYALPLGIALNFQVNGRDVLVPMVIEEPSVVAGASFMAKLARAGGGFTATSTPPEMIGQIQILDLQDIAERPRRAADTSGRPTGRGGRDRSGAQQGRRRSTGSAGAHDRQTHRLAPSWSCTSSTMCATRWAPTL